MQSYLRGDNMTVEEALKSIVEDGIELGAGDFVDLDALKVARKALEKQIAKNPVGLYKNICPSCYGIVLRGMEFFCPKCGQRILWKESEV